MAKQTYRLATRVTEVAPGLSFSDLLDLESANPRRTYVWEHYDGRMLGFFVDTNIEVDSWANVIVAEDGLSTASGGVLYSLVEIIYDCIQS